MLMSLRLQKLHAHSLVVLHWMVFRKTKPFVKWKNTEFTNISSFTSLLTWSTHYTLFGRILLFSLPTSKIISLCVFWSPWRVCLGGPVQAHLVFTSLSIEDHQNLTHFDSGLTIHRTFLPRAGSFCTYCFVFSVLYTKMHWRLQFSRYNTNFFDHFTVLWTE